MGPHELLGTAVLKQGGKIVINFLVTRLYVSSTQSVIDDISARVQGQQLSDTYNAAQSQVQQRLEESRAKSASVVTLVEGLLKAAGFAGVVGDLSGLIAIATAPSPDPISSTLRIISVTAKVYQLGTLGTGIVVPVARGSLIPSEAREAGRLAFNPSSPSTQASRDVATNPPTAQWASPLGSASAASNSELAPARQGYEQVLAQLETAVQATRLTEVMTLASSLTAVDQTLHQEFLIARAPVQAAVLQVGHDDPGYPQFGPALDQVSQTGMSYLGARLQLQLNLALYLMQQGGDGSALLSSVTNTRNAVVSYQNAIQTAQDISRDIPVPGYVRLVRHELNPNQPTVAQPFRLRLTLRNLGRASARAVDVQISVTSPLQVLSQTSYQYSDITVEQTQAIDLDLVTPEATESQVTVTITDDAGQAVVERMQISISNGEHIICVAVVGVECRTVSIPANTPWTDTGLDLTAGSSVNITTSGVIKIAGSDPGKTPAGDPNCRAPADAVAPGLTCSSLIGRIGNGAPFQVGTGTSFSAPTAGRLYLGVNDNVFGDNSGSWTVRINY